MVVESEAVIKSDNMQRVGHVRNIDDSQRFRFNVGAKSFAHQYDKCYEFRLNNYKPLLEANVKSTWGGDIPIRQVCDTVQGEECVVIGTIFKQMNLQPSILKELGDEIDVPVQAMDTDNFTTDNDVLFLEDMVQRIVLIGDIAKDELVTGVVLAVKGLEEAQNPGQFTVQSVCFPELNVPHPLDPAPECDLLLVSGLEFGGSSTNHMALQLLSDFVSGRLDEVEQCANIARIFVAGNSISHEVVDKEQHYKAKYLTKNAVAGTVEAMKELSCYLQRLTQNIQVTIMPGENDPTNLMLPQQPLHPCMLQDNSGVLETATNPYTCDINGIRILGHSGQPVNNIRSYSKLTDTVDIMKKCLAWSHMAPTAPDTLASYPYTDSDPYIIQTCPHLFFVGNQSKFDSSVYTKGEHKCLCVSVPSFSQSGMCVRVNLKTLEAEPLSFST